MTDFHRQEQMRQYEMHKNLLDNRKKQEYTNDTEVFGGLESAGKKERVKKILLGTEFYQCYASMFLHLYPCIFVSFMITYLIYLPEKIEYSLKWQVYVPNLYLVLLILTLGWVEQTIENRLIVKYMSNLFFVGSYQQVMYVFDNFNNFLPLYAKIIENIDNFSEYFDDDYFWMVVGIIIACCTVMAIFTISAPGILMGVVVIMLLFLLVGIIYFMMMLFPFCFYFYQAFMWTVYPTLLLHDTVNNLKQIIKLSL